MRDKIALTRAYPEDTDFIIAAMNDPAVAHWLTSIPQPYGLNEAAEFIANAGPDEFAIRVNGKIAGMLRIGSSLGIWIAPEFQGRGIALRTAVIGLSRYFMNAVQNGMDAVYLDGNHRSASLLAKLGFQEKAPVTAWSRTLSKEVPAMSVHLTRDDFAARHGISLETARLRISAYSREDLPDLHRIVTIPKVARMLVRYFPEMTPAEVEESFAGDGLVPPIRLVIRHEGKAIGAVALLAGEPYSIAYYIDPAFAGQGIGQEVAAGFVDEITERFGLVELEASAFDDNPASAKILRNLGFQRVEDISMRSQGRDTLAPAGVFRWRAGK